MKITTILLVVLLLIPLVLAQPLHYYQLDLIYDNGTIIKNNLKVIPSNRELNNFGGSYEIEIISFNNKTLNTTSFAFPLIIQYDYLDKNGTIVGGGTNYTNKATTTIYVPYHPAAKELKILDFNSTEKLRIKVEDYAQEKPNQTKEEVKPIGNKMIVQVQTEIQKAPVWKLLILIIGLMLFILFIGILLFRSIRRRK